MNAKQHYADRAEAGRCLAGLLAAHKGTGAVVVGLPRGGVVVAAEIARKLDLTMDVIIAGKLRAPVNPELAIGAVTESGEMYLNESAVEMLKVSDEYLAREKESRLETIRRRLAMYRDVREKVPLEGRAVIIADDGLATGSTMISAVQAASAEGAASIVVAVPGGPGDTVERIRAMEEVDTVVCPLVPPEFYAVSQLYLEFAQVEDATVVELLREFSR